MINNYKTSVARVATRFVAWLVKRAFTGRPVLFCVMFSVLFWGLAFCAFAQSAPIQYQVFCIGHASNCASGTNKPLQYTQKLVNDLASVNLTINKTIKPVNDVGDVWSVNVSQGDCEDYALTKRAKLEAMGYNAGSLRMAVTRAYGQYHAVLVVKTTKGDFVLDNLHDNVRSRNSYNILSQEGKNSEVWE